MDLSENWFVYLAIVVSVAWICAVIWLYRTDAGDGVRRNKAGYMAFGFLWPLIGESASRSMTKREMVGMTLMLAIFLAASIFVAIPEIIK